MIDGKMRNMMGQMSGQIGKQTIDVEMMIQKSTRRGRLTGW